MALPKITFFDTHQLFSFKRYNIIAGCKNYSTFLTKSNSSKVTKRLNSFSSKEIFTLLENKPTYIITRDPEDRLKSQLSHTILYRISPRLIKSFNKINFYDRKYIEEFSVNSIKMYWDLLNTEGLDYTLHKFTSIEKKDVLTDWAKHAIEVYFNTIVKDDHMSKYHEPLLDLLRPMNLFKNIKLVHKPDIEFFESLGFTNPSGSGFRFKSSHIIWKDLIYVGVLNSNKREFFSSYLKDEYKALELLYSSYERAFSSSDEVATREFG